MRRAGGAVGADEGVRNVTVSVLVEPAGGGSLGGDRAGVGKVEELELVQGLRKKFLWKR